MSLEETRARLEKATPGPWTDVEKLLAVAEAAEAFIDADNAWNPADDEQAALADALAALDAPSAQNLPAVDKSPPEV